MGVSPQVSAPLRPPHERGPKSAAGATPGVGQDLPGDRGSGGKSWCYAYGAPAGHG